MFLSIPSFQGLPAKGGQAGDLFLQIKRIAYQLINTKDLSVKKFKILFKSHC